MSVRKTLLALIQQHQLDNFTISDLKSLCTDLIAATSSKQLGVKIYKQVWVLRQEGVLTASKHPTDPQKNTYSLSDNGQQLVETMSTAAIPSAIKTKPGLEALQRKLSDYSSALASASAEAQEYQELSREFPELKHSLQSKFMLAKERAVMYQGRLSAIESVLQDFN
jgi:DNA-binding PadR family transcriptional regulator